MFSRYFYIILIIFSLCFEISYSRDKKYEDFHVPEITYFHKCNHSFLCFDNKYYIHDPDCICVSNVEWIGYLMDDKRIILERYTLPND